MILLRKLFLLLALMSAVAIAGVGCGGDDEFEEAGEEMGETMEETGEEADEATDR